MKKTLIYTFIQIVLLFNAVSNAQHHKDLIVPSDVPFPESIFDGKSGTVHVGFKVNKKGEIIECNIESISLIYQDKNNKYGFRSTSIYQSLYNQSPKYTKLGLELFNKLQEWLKDFRSKTMFQKGKDFQLQYYPAEWAIYGYSIHFGKWYPEKDRHKFPIK